MKKVRGEGEAELFVIGRDIEEETNYGLRWNNDACVWAIEGTAAQVCANATQRALAAELRAASEPMLVSELAQATGKERTWVQRALNRMLESGAVTREGRGPSFRWRAR